MGPASQTDQSVIPEMEADDPAHFAPGEVVVDFDKINEFMSQRRAAAREAVGKAEAVAVDTSSKEASAPAPEKKTTEANKPPKRRGRPPKKQAGPTIEKKSKAAESHTDRYINLEIKNAEYHQQTFSDPLMILRMVRVTGFEPAAS